MPPAELVLDVLLHAVLPAACVAAVLTALAALVGKRDETAAHAGSALALAAGLAVGDQLRGTLPWVPDERPMSWLAAVVLAVLAAGVVARLPQVPGWVGWALRGAASALAGWLLTPADLRQEWLVAPAALAAVVLLQWAVLEQVERVEPGGLVPLALAAAALAAAVVLVHAGIARFADLAVVLMAALAGVGGVALVLGRRAGGVVPGAAVLLPALLLLGEHETFTEVPADSFVLVGLSPLLLAPSLLPAWRRYERKGLWAAQAVLVLIPLAVAVGRAAAAESLEYE